MQKNFKVVFIFGSPRSGTTLLENLLNQQSQIAEWYEPYYLWEQFFPVQNSDVWDINHLSNKISDKIRHEFHIYSHKAGKPIIVDKSPLHAFNLKIIYQIFPDAKFIHLLRDGRDATLSIRKEWKKRANLVKNKDMKRYLTLIYNMLKRQPFWRYRLMAIFYEIHLNFIRKNLFHPKNYLNKARWMGYPGWGPRFEGWQNFIASHTELEFNAMQWVKSVEAVINDWEVLPEKNKMEIRYEDLIQYPQETLKFIFDLVNVNVTPDFFKSIPKINSNNFNKWVTEFTETEIKQIRPILSPLINKLCYAQQSSW